jgi:hypothetical protein
MPTQRGTTPGRLTPKGCFIKKTHLSWNRTVCAGIHKVNNLVNKAVAPVRTVPLASGFPRGRTRTASLCARQVVF